LQIIIDERGGIKNEFYDNYYSKYVVQVEKNNASGAITTIRNEPIVVPYLAQDFFFQMLDDIDYPLIEEWR
jgi:hypothetical protein